MLTDTRNHEADTFTAIFQDNTGESEWTIIGFAATLNDPHAYIQSVIEDLQDELSEVSPTLWEDFIDRAKTFLEEVDASLQIKAFKTEAADRWATEPEVSPKYDRNDYKHKAVYFSTSDPSTKTSRNEWRRVTEDNHSLRLLVDYGNFDIAKTEAAGKAWLRVRTQVRNNTPWLSVGSVQINMRNGYIYCGVSGCKHEGHLYTSTNKEELEFQVLRILKHLGGHALHDKQKVFPVFQEEVSRQRDTPKQKLATHRKYCNNKECKHGKPVRRR